MFYGRFRATIDAPRETVWSFVTRLDMFSVWSGYRTSELGVLDQGRELDAWFSDPRGGSRLIRIYVQKLEPEHTVVLSVRRSAQSYSIGRWVLALNETQKGCQIRLTMFGYMGSTLGVPSLNPLVEPIAAMFTWPVWLPMVELMNHVWPFTYMSPLHKLRRLIYRERSRL